MSHEFAAKFVAFKGEDEYISQTNVLVEVVEVANGSVELAFNTPIPGSPRIYLSVPLAEVVNRAMRSDNV